MQRLKICQAALLGEQMLGKADKEFVSANTFDLGVHETIFASQHVHLSKGVYFPPQMNFFF